MDTAILENGLVSLIGRLLEMQPAKRAIEIEKIAELGVQRRMAQTAAFADLQERLETAKLEAKNLHFAAVCYRADASKLRRQLKTDN